MSGQAMEYPGWDKSHETDEECQRGDDAVARREAADRVQSDPQLRMAAKALKVSRMAKQCDGRELVERSSKELYKNSTHVGGVLKKMYKFPETLAEQQTICKAAIALKERGNAFYAKGEWVQAAKMYEQGVLKFVDWYVESLATDKERNMVHAVKLPCHLNLAECSRRLGNYQHVVVQCTQVINFMDAHNVKALFRRGASYLQLGNLDDAHRDLKRALALSPGDSHVRAEFAALVKKEREYRARARGLAVRWLARDGAMDLGKLRPAHATDLDASLEPGREGAQASEAAAYKAISTARYEGKMDSNQHDKVRASLSAKQTVASETASTLVVVQTAPGCDAELAQADGCGVSAMATNAHLSAIEQKTSSRQSALVASLTMPWQLSMELLAEQYDVEALFKLEQEAHRMEGQMRAAPNKTRSWKQERSKAWQTLRQWMAILSWQQQQGLSAYALLAMGIGIGALIIRMIPV